MTISLTPKQQQEIVNLSKMGGHTPDEIINIALHSLRQEYESKLIRLRRKLEKAEQTGGSSTIEEYKAGFAKRRAAYIKAHRFNA